MKPYSYIAVAFTAALTFISIKQAFLYSSPQKFILQTARLAQTPLGKNGNDAHGPSALLDGVSGRTAMLEYPLGPDEENSLWIELGVSHFPEADHKNPESSGQPVRIQNPETRGERNPGDETIPDPGRVSVVFQQRIPDRIRIINGMCSEASLNAKAERSTEIPIESNITSQLVKLRKARLEFYYRPLNDPDQDFGYPRANPVDSYEIDIPAQATSFDLPVNLPAPEMSETFPGSMHMILLKLTVLEVQPAEKARNLSNNGISDLEGPRKTLAICEIQYADRPVDVDESDDFFVFW